MTPVISPWYFYIMSVVDDIEFMIVLTISVGIIGLVFFTFYNLFESRDFEDFIENFKPIKPFVIGMVICSLVGIAVPNGETITKMLIAQNVTYERVEEATDTVETVYNDIMALFEDKGETE